VASRFINVDTTTSTGLKRAKALGLAQSGKVDAIYTPLIFEADILFDPEHQGRLFTIFRHPVERAKSMFKYLQYVSLEAHNIPFQPCLHHHLRRLMLCYTLGLVVYTGSLGARIHSKTS